MEKKYELKVIKPLPSKLISNMLLRTDCNFDDTNFRIRLYVLCLYIKNSILEIERKYDTNASQQTAETNCPFVKIIDEVHLCGLKENEDTICACLHENSKGEIIRDCNERYLKMSSDQ